MISSGGGINWTWFLEYELKDGKIKIQRHWRIHNGEPQPETNSSFRLHETEERTILSVTIYKEETGEENFIVINPKYIFDYPEE